MVSRDKGSTPSSLGNRSPFMGGVSLGVDVEVARIELRWAA